MRLLVLGCYCHRAPLPPTAATMTALHQPARRCGQLTAQSSAALTHAEKLTKRDERRSRRRRVECWPTTSRLTDASHSLLVACQLLRAQGRGGARADAAVEVGQAAQLLRSFEEQQAAMGASFSLHASLFMLRTPSQPAMALARRSLIARC